MKPIVLVVGLLGVVLNVFGAPVAQMETMSMMMRETEPLGVEPVELFREQHAVDMELESPQAEERMGKGGKFSFFDEPPPPPPPPPQNHITIIYPAIPIRPQYGYPQTYGPQSYGSQSQSLGYMG